MVSKEVCACRGICSQTCGSTIVHRVFELGKIFILMFVPMPVACWDQHDGHRSLKLRPLMKLTRFPSAIDTARLALATMCAGAIGMSL